jgi:DNA-binding SARP family transcriptional activator
VAPVSTTTAVQIDLLRGFSVRADGAAVDLPRVAQRLVAFLALQDRPRQRLFVAGSLWTDASEEHAAASLRSTLWRLGRAYARLVTTRGSAIGLADDVRVDIHAVTACGRRIIAEPGAHDLADLELLTVAGDLLPDWYDDWVLLERERVRHLRLHALEALCGALAERGRFAEAAEAGLAAIAGEPLRESAHRAVIAAHLAEGNPGEAMRQYELCRRLFAEHLGMAPSPHLEALVTHLRRS